MPQILTDRWFSFPTQRRSVDAAAQLRAEFDVLKEGGLQRQDALCKFRNMYRDRAFEGLTPWNYRRSKGGPMPENMLRPVVDTLTAKLIRDRPRVTAATVGAGLEARRRAKNLSLFWDGVWEQNRVYARLARYVREGLVTGEGVWHVRKERLGGKKGRICIDLVATHELFVDEAEAFSGAPRNLYRRRFIDRRHLMSLFPEQRSALAAATSATADENHVSHEGPEIDLLAVLEAWHLPTTRDAEDGRYLLIAGEVPLKHEPWTYENFPFVRFSPSPPMADDGYWGTGVVEQLCPAQDALTATARVVNEAQHLLGHPIILYEEGSGLKTAHWHNTTGIMVGFKGREPRVYTPDPVSPQMYGDVENRRRKIIEDSGVSRMSLTSQKPVGFDPSGKAIQEMSDVESERFMELGRALHESMIQLGYWTVRLARELDGEIDGGYKIVARDGREALELSWKDVDVHDDAMVMHIETTAFHGRSFSGKLADIERLANMGAIQDPAELAGLLDMPDVTAHIEKIASPSRVVDMMAEVMLKTGEMVPPEPYMDLNAAIPQMQLIYLRERKERKGADGPELELLRRWMDQAAAMLQSSAQSATIAQQAADASVVSPDSVVADGQNIVGGAPPAAPDGGGLPPVA